MNRLQAGQHILSACFTEQLALTQVDRSANNFSFPFMHSISVSWHDEAPTVAIVQFSYPNVSIFDQEPGSSNLLHKVVNSR